jgi:O-antigen/teichoic acid export membrane protein
MMLQRMLGEDAVGVYTTLFFFGFVVGIPARGLVRIALVRLSESFAKNDMNTIQQVYQKGSEVLMVVGGFVFLMIWGNRYSVEMYLGPAYKEGIYVLFFIGMAQFIEISTSVNSQIISVSKHYWFNLVLALLSVCLLIVSNYFFIQWYGLVGAAIGSALSMITLNIIRYLFLKTKYNLSPFSKNTVKCLCIFGLVFLIIELLPNATNLFVNLLYKGSVVTMLFMPLVYFTKCSIDVNTVINKYLAKIGVKL